MPYSAQALIFAWVLVMKATLLNNPPVEPQSFDLRRLGKSKKEVDISPNTIRSYAKQGLRLYKVGKAVFFSCSELAAFIRTRAA